MVIKIVAVFLSDTMRAPYLSCLFKPDLLLCGGPLEQHESDFRESMPPAVGTRKPVGYSSFSAAEP